MNIYLSAQWSRRSEIEGYAQELRDLGHTVTSRWHHGEPMGDDAEPTVEAWKVWAQADLEDIDDAHALIAFTEPKGTMSRGGRHVEWGYWLARRDWDQPSIVIGPCESQFYAKASHVYADWTVFSTSHLVAAQVLIQRGDGGVRE